MSDKQFRNIRPMSLDTRQAFEYSDTSPEASKSTPDVRRRPGETVKHRKVPESITRNACLSCKKARAKCDGRTPCKRCATRSEGGECIYEIHLKHAKEDLVKQIKELQIKDTISQQIFQALTTDTHAPEVLEMLRNEEPLEVIAQRLNQQRRVSHSSPSSSASPMTEETDLEMRDGSPDATQWTDVISDSTILDDLFQLYFSWVHPVYTLFDEGQFVRSYHVGDVGASSHCSPVLVNALCAMACHLHSQPSSDIPRYQKLSFEFSDAVRENIDPDDKHLTTIQAMGAIALLELVRGNGLRAASLLQVAMNCLVNNEAKFRKEDPEGWKMSFRGIKELNIEWSMLTFRIPIKIISKLNIDSHTISETAVRDKTKWYFYNSPNDPVISYSSYQATIAQEKSKLMAIIEELCNTLYSQHGPPIAARQIYRLCKRLFDWKARLPVALQQLEEKSLEQTLPQFLSLLILYSNSLIQLLRPLLSYDDFPTHLVEDIIWSEAQSGFSILENQYRRHFTFRYQPVLQMYALLHFAEVIARHFPGGMENQSKDGPEALKAAINILDDSKRSFPVADIMQEMLRRAAVSCSIRLSTKDSEARPSSSSSQKTYCMNDFIQACTRTSFIQPAEEIQRRFSPSLIDDWLALYDSIGPLIPSPSTTPQGGKSPVQSSMNINRLLNRNE